MSGMNTDCPYPNCGKEADLSEDWKPFSHSSITCIHCGFTVMPVIQYLTLKDLNEQRRELGLPRLRKKPERKTPEEIWL